MKNITLYFALIVLFVSFSSCEKDEGKLPNLSFRTGSSYAGDQTMAGGSTYIIGIDASKSEKKDVLKKFNISKSVNGGTATTVYDHDISSSEEDSYGYDYTGTLETTSGAVVKLTFSITNRDGITNQLVRTLTVQ